VATIALTGGTGFVGQRLIPHLLAQGHDVRALARQAQADSEKLNWVCGDLDNLAALHILCAGSDAVIHLAGVIKGRNSADFDRGNVAGTANMLRAAADTGVLRFLHISSLAARQPQLSHYCRSKAEAETKVRGSGLDWTILRPPAVYGPGDRETLALFKAAKGLVLPIPAGDQRLSWIYVEDLCAAIGAALAPAVNRQLIEVDDGMGGRSHRQFAETVAKAVGGSPRILALPRWLLSSFGQLTALICKITGKATILTPGKIREIFHQDWAVTSQLLQQSTAWRPSTSLDEGLAQTAVWYHRAGWL
jgi:nucleoside-diphosphate-sugar epimerase